MRKRKTRPRRRGLLLLAVLVLSGLLLGVPAAAAGKTGTDYIIKYKESAAWLMEDRSVPFEVVPEAEMRRLREEGLLEWYEPDGEMAFLEDGTSPYFGDGKWDLRLIGAERAFQQGALGQGVRVGVLDSGVNRVELLTDCLLPGHNYVENEDRNDVTDRYGHGTLVAALIAGQGTDGYVGDAPGAQIVPLKITDGKVVRVSAVCRGIYGAVDDYGCRVLNLSLGFNDHYKALREAVDHAVETGAVVVSAVGNYGNDTLLYPAAYENVIGVGAVDESEQVFTYSNRNDSVFLTAPGVQVKTSGRLGGYTAASGTSFSVPYVSGAAAVLLGLDPLLTPEDVAAILAETARDVGPPGWDASYGWGILDLGESAGRLSGGQSAQEHDTPCGFLSPTTLVNYTGETIACTYLLAEYDGDGVCLGVSRTELTLPPKGRTRVEPPRSEYFGQFAVETETGKPLAPARKNLPGEEGKSHQ